MIEIKNRWNGSVIKALDEANLSGADGLPSAPIVPQIDVKILAALKTGGVLEMGSWHKCDTEDTDDCVSPGMKENARSALAAGTGRGER